MRNLYFILMIFLAWSCEQEQKADFNTEYLTQTTWGTIFAEEVGPSNQDYEKYSSIKFNKEGTVLFNEAQTDFWKVYTSKSILIEERNQIWQILELTKDTLHVEKLERSSFDLIVRGYHTPLNEQ